MAEQSMKDQDYEQLCPKQMTEFFRDIHFEDWFGRFLQRVGPLKGGGELFERDRARMEIVPQL
jgi:hypothetical protein